MLKYYYRLTFNSVSACMLGECLLRRYTALYKVQRDLRTLEVCVLIQFTIIEKQEILNLTNAVSIEEMTSFS
jgi:hypothetical protein